MADPWDLDWQKPADLDPIIRSAAEKYDIPEARLRAVIATESNFDPNAVSHAGAEGLMQLMPGTAKELGVTDAFDPAQNIDGGARYLKAQYDRFGNWDQAHAAYDAGPARIARGGDLPDETRDYVQKVNARAADAPPWQMGWKGDAQSGAPPWEQSWGGKPSPDAAAAVKAMQDFGDQQALAVSQAAVQPADKPQPKSTEDIIGELAAMPLKERATRIAMGIPVGAVETAVQMAAQVPQMVTQAAGFAKALYEGKISRKDFEESAASVTPKWVSDLASAESLQPETYAGALMSAGMGEGFAAAGRAAAAPGAGIVASTQALANGEGIEGARKRFSDLYAQVAPVTEQMLNAGLIVTGGVEGGRRLAAKRESIAQDPNETAAPVLQAQSLDEAINSADKAANGPESPTATPAGPEPVVEPPAEPLPGEPTIGMPPEALLPPETAPPEAPAAPLEAASAEAPLEPSPEMATPVTQEAPQAPVPPEAVPAAPVPEGAPQARAVADMTPRELEMAARLTRSEARRTELADEQARRAPEPVEAGTDLTAMTDGELDHALRLSRGASRDAITTELLSRMPREEATPETENGRDQGNAKPVEDAAGEPAQPGAPVGDGNAGNAQPPAAGAEGGGLPADAGDHRLDAGEVGQRFLDYTAPRDVPASGIVKGEVRTFATQKMAAAFAKGQRLDGYAPRATPDGWIVSKPIAERSPAQKAVAARLRDRAVNVQPDDDLATLLRKNGGIKATELTRDGADPKDVAASLKFGAARKVGGMSLDGAAEVMAEHGYDVYDEHGAIDATKARNLIQDVLDGERVFSPQGHEIRAAKEAARRDAGFEPTTEELAKADLTPPDAPDASLVTQAAAIDEGAVERLAIQYRDDDPGFYAAIKEFVDGRSQDQADAAATRGEARSEAPAGRGAEEPAEGPATSEAVDVPSALARVKVAADAIRNSKPEDVGKVMGELDAARTAAERAGAQPTDIVRAIEGRQDFRPMGPERLAALLERPREVAKPPETPAEAGVSASAVPEARPAIDQVPPAILARERVTVERYHEGEGVKKVEVSAKEALHEVDSEISAYEKLLECVRGA